MTGLSAPHRRLRKRQRECKWFLVEKRHSCYNVFRGKQAGLPVLPVCRLRQIEQLGEDYLKIGLDVGSTTIKTIVLDDSGKIIYSAYERHFSQITA